jgi:hypothetical protein
LTRMFQHVVTVDLPLPPSVNKAYSARRGSFLTMKTASYRFWLRSVREMHGNGSDLPFLGTTKFGLWIDLPRSLKGDIDNRVKLLADIIKYPDGPDDYKLGVVQDDKLMRGLHVELCDGLAGDMCQVTVVDRGQWPQYVCMRMEI